MVSWPCSQFFAAPRALYPRLVKRNPRFRVEISDLAVEGGPPDLLSNADEIFVADMDGDRRMDLVIVHREPPAVVVAVAEGPRHFRAGSLSLPAPEKSIGGAIIVPGMQGRLPVLALAPPQVGEPYQLVSLAHDTTDFAPANLPLRRYPAMTLITAQGGSPQFVLVETDTSSWEAHSWTFFPREGWRSRNLGIGTPDTFYHGIGVLSISDLYHGVFIIQGRSIWALTGEPTLLGSVMEPDVPTDVAVGDFDGDGSSDVLTLGRGGLRSAWLVRALPETPLQVPLPGFAEAIGDRRVIGAGDFDNDGADEVLLRDRRSLAIAKLRAESPGSGPVEVVVNGRPIAFDTEGRAQEQVAGTTRTFEIRGPGWSRRLTVPEGAQCTQSIGIYPEALPHALSASRTLGLMPCVGFNAGYGKLDRRWGRTTSCPQGYAAIESDLKHSSCCKLPDDALEKGSDRWVDGGACPPGTTMTGFPDTEHPLPPSACPGCRQPVQCTAINISKYRLLPSQPGRMWGEGSRLARGVRHLSHSEAPPGIREAIGRQGWQQWDSWGCLGQPWGALMVARGPTCEQSRFSQLVPLGVDEATVPPLFPFKNCRIQPDTFDPFADCDE